MSIERFSNEWFAALDALVAERSEMPFAWGTNDCCTLAADWVKTVRGDDPMADLRDYVSMLGAYKLLEAEGGIVAAIDKRMGVHGSGMFAQVGDVAVVRHGDNQLSAGVCVGAHIIAPGERGLMMVPINQAEASWRV